MATKNDPGEFDCYEKAGPNEPVFVLRARDPMAPGLVRDWARDYRYAKEAMNPHCDGLMTDRQVRKYQEALRCATAMEDWARENPA